eukprot:TRINITY_DN377_c0_g1_i3.p1 TRINITY_DN377_c0_g1~~TRINITY_DN377_c0_g1_i3.p1  ORF type:complete len:205 (-),score=82.44 TRINITY_DN377_c0_g1_i3:30-644(-)
MSKLTDEVGGWGLSTRQVHAAMSECKEDPSEGTFNCEELAEAVAGMVMAISELRGNDEGYKKAYVVTQEIEGMDSGAFTEKLRTVIQGVAGGGASANGGRLSVALVAASKDDVRDAIRAGFPGLNAQQLQALVLLTEPAKGGGWSCDKVVTWGFKTMQGLARTSYLKRQAAARGGGAGGGGGESDSGSVPGSQDKSLSLEENDE